MSRGIKGSWFNGLTSRAEEAVLGLGGDGRVTVTSNIVEVSADYLELKISNRLGTSPRRIEFPAGAAFETSDNDAVDALISCIRPSASPWLHRLETNWQFMVVALLVMIIIAWGTFRYVIPAASNSIAAIIPPQILSAVGEQSFAAINRFGLQSSSLSAKQQEKIRSEFNYLVGESDLGDIACRIEFRSAAKTFGPNAFALPPCLIIMTDELVSIAESDQEIVAVLAHELGHIKHRHAMRRIVQDAFLTFILMLMTGDTTQVSAAIASVPVVFLEFGYARGFEREADRFARDYMLANGIPLHLFPSILNRMEDWIVSKACETQECIDSASESAEAGLLDYLATHPSTAERATMFAAPD